MHCPLGRAVLCVEDDTVFEIGQTCPTCGRDQWVSLARLLRPVGDDPARRSDGWLWLEVGP